MPINPFFDHYAHLTTFLDPVLRDLALNDAAPYDYRKFAVELLLKRKSPYSRHSGLQGFVREIEVELDGIQTEFPSTKEPEPPKPMSASVTTATMFGGDVIDMEALREYVKKEAARDAEKLFPKSQFTGFDDIPSVSGGHHKWKTVRKKSDIEKTEKEPDASQ